MSISAALQTAQPYVYVQSFPHMVCIPRDGLSFPVLYRRPWLLIHLKHHGLMLFFNRTGNWEVSHAWSQPICSQALPFRLFCLTWASLAHWVLFSTYHLIVTSLSYFSCIQGRGRKWGWNVAPAVSVPLYQTSKGFPEFSTPPWRTITYISLGTYISTHIYLLHDTSLVAKLTGKYIFSF